MSHFRVLACVTLGWYRYLSVYVLVGSLRCSSWRSSPVLPQAFCGSFIAWPLGALDGARNLYLPAVRLHSPVPSNSCCDGRLLGYGLTMVSPLTLYSRVIRRITGTWAAAHGYLVGMAPELQDLRVLSKCIVWVWFPSKVAPALDQPATCVHMRIATACLLYCSTYSLMPCT